MSCIFSVDVEDWFHILALRSAPDLDLWDSLPSSLEANFFRLLDIFDEQRQRITCFFLGWAARKFPHLVRQAAARGHEIASHGQRHRLVSGFSAEEFRKDARESRLALEDAAGLPVIGYRAAGFSVTAETAWFFEELLGAGYLYDSSIFPARRAHGGMARAVCAPHVVRCPGGALVELPISVISAGAVRMCLFGGGYLRLFPVEAIAVAARNVLAHGRPVIFYVHPRDLDPDQPRLPMGLRRAFKSYVHLDTTEAKLRVLSHEFRSMTCSAYVRQHWPELWDTPRHCGDYVASA